MPLDVALTEREGGLGRRSNGRPKVKAAIFVEAKRIVLEDEPIPDVGPLDALMKVAITP